MRLLARVAICCSLALLRCSPASVGSSGLSAAAAEQACNDSAFARCSHLRTCSSFLLQFRYGDVPTCQASFRASCLQNLAAPSTASTPAGAEACVDKIPDWDCADFLDNVNPPPECAQAKGPFAAGAVCAVPSQCQTGFCAIEPGSVCGSCATPPKAGDSCQHLTSCGQGLACQLSTLHCASFGGVGAQCGTGLPCAPGLGCAGYVATTSTPGTCQPAAASMNATCNSHGAGCDFSSGLACNTSSMTCATAVLAGGGEPCGYVGDQNQPCGAAGTCVGSSGPTPGTCQAAAGTGGACDLVKGPSCFPPSRCITSGGAATSGTCQVPDPGACH